MSGRITTPTRASAAGAAKAAATCVPSGTVSVRVPRSPTSPVRGGAGGRLSWSWHMPGVLPPRGLAGRLGPAAPDFGRDLAPGLGEPLVLLVGLPDQPVELGGVEPRIHVGQLAQRL